MSVRVAPALQVSDLLPERQSNFTSLQWLVIAIGARDGSVPLHWSSFGRLLHRLLEDRPQPLANPCLETLRRTAALARTRGWNLPAAEIGSFLRAGWTEAQLETLVESVHPDPCMDACPPCAAGTGEPSPEPRQSDSILHTEIYT